MLAISAIVGNEFVIDLTTLDLSSAAGAADAFNAAASYTWTIATADGGIVGFSPAAFILDTSAFANAYSGSFGIAQSGNNINLTYTGQQVTGVAMPEPASATFLMLAGTCFLASRTRSRRHVEHARGERAYPPATTESANRWGQMVPMNSLSRVEPSARSEAASR